MATKKIPFLKEILITAATAMVTGAVKFYYDKFHDHIYFKRKQVENMIEFNERISKDVPVRLFLLHQFHRSIYDTTFLSYRLRYLDAKEEWNGKYASYRALIKHYYGPGMQTYFMSAIYNPMVDLGIQEEANFKKGFKDPTFETKWSAIDLVTFDYFDSLYTLLGDLKK